MDIVIFRETQKMFTRGSSGSREQPSAPADQVPQRRHAENGKKQVRLDSGVGIKRFRSPELSACPRRNSTALRNKLKSVTLVHKGNIQKFTEGAFRNWAMKSRRGISLAGLTERESWIIDNKDKNQASPSPITLKGRPGMEYAPPAFRKAVEEEVKSVLDAIYATHGKGAWKTKLMINDRIADSSSSRSLRVPRSIPCSPPPTSTAHYISDACAAQVGGLGSLGGEYRRRYAIFEATHGTAPKYADKDSSTRIGHPFRRHAIRHIGWSEAADLIEQGMEKTILQKKVTYDFERLMDGATKSKPANSATISSTTWLQRWPQTSRELLKVFVSRRGFSRAQSCQ